MQNEVFVVWPCFIKKVAGDKLFVLPVKGEKIKEVTTWSIGLKSRIIYRVKEKETNEANYWAGEYKLLMKAKSIPSPFGSPNMVDCTRQSHRRTINRNSNNCSINCPSLDWERLWCHRCWRWEWLSYINYINSKSW